MVFLQSYRVLGWYLRKQLSSHLEKRFTYSVLCWETRPLGAASSVATALDQARSHGEKVHRDLRSWVLLVVPGVG